MPCKSCLSGRLGAVGFTLIELLVVVLIIGILAAIALPQYQKATERAKATEAVVILKSLVQATQYYYLANGTWPTQFSELAVEIPWTGNEKGYTGLAQSPVKDTRSNEDWSLQILGANTIHPIRLYLTRLHHPRYKGATFMYSFQDTQIPVGESVCYERKNDGVIFPGSTGDYCQKIMHGQSAGGSYPQFYHKLF